jgi:TPR repeat protein
MNIRGYHAFVENASKSIGWAHFQAAGCLEDIANVTEAIQLFKMSAESGNSFAQYRYAQLCSSEPEANEWLERAAKLSHAGATACLLTDHWQSITLFYSHFVFEEKHAKCDSKLCELSFLKRCSLLKNQEATLALQRFNDEPVVDNTVRLTNLKSIFAATMKSRKEEKSRVLKDITNTK